MNKVCLVGNVTRDLELMTSSGGTDYVKFTLAVTRPMKRDKTDFIPIAAFGQLASLCAKYLRKGSKAGVDGRIQTDSYTAKDGSKKYTTEVIADNVEFLTAKGEQKTSPENEFADYTPPDGLPF